MDSNTATVEAGGRASGLGGKLGLTLLALALLGAAAGFGTWSAFTATTNNSNNSFAAGSVTIGDNDASTAMLALSNAKPGDADTSCITVSYTGSLPASVRLSAATTGTGLDQYLNLTVTRGTISSGAFDSCTNFTADSSTYVTGKPAGVIFDGTVAGFPASASPLVDPNGSWSNGTNVAYKFVVSVQTNNAAQGKNANSAFTWEARS